ncbi:hypothetical protein MMOR_52550 [Mycolicibacterium moriokaense]|uniref:Uncharacterized protein n=1 Tax=Mycolicibacterium moriokaense TaxID=39691 RepID=A0AAD1HG42_9MYCO|nr:hypothetical protein MMOR_52550 [Mycolicibacterium moriokaense]
MELTVKVPDVAEQAIRNLRRECAKYRRQRNEARAEVARLRAELAALRGAE